MTWINKLQKLPGINIGSTIHKIYRWIHSKVTNTSTLPLKYEGILSTQFISTSLLLCIIWIIIKSSSSHLHRQVIFINSGSSLNLEHHWIIIVASTISIKWCYLFILLVIGSYTEPTLFHVGCRPSLQVGLHIIQHLYPTMGGPTCHHVGKAHPTLISYHGRNTSNIHVKMAHPVLTSDHV